MHKTLWHTAQVPVAAHGQRFDQIAAHCFPAYSRSRLQTWIKQGQLRLNDQCCKPRASVLAGDTLTLSATLPIQDRWQPEALPLDVVYEDAAIIVLNKPAGWVVHPGAGNGAGTVLNALLHRYPELAAVPRAGIVHRLDKDTTGLMVIARHMPAQTHLVAQLQARTVKREYEAIVQGVMVAGGTVDQPIGRHPRQRLKMAVVAQGKPAMTHYRVIRRFRAHTHIRVRLATGRTHQIRVHMQHQRYPLVGDGLYGGPLRLPKACPADLATQLRQFARQALHACQLGLIHPESQKPMTWQAPLPEDYQCLLHSLAKEAEVRS